MKEINFNFLNFCTRYSSKGSINKPMKREYCFSDIFYAGKFKPDNSYILEIWKEKYEDGDDNNCLLTKEQLIEHIEEIQNFHKFKYKLTEQEKKYILKFRINAPLIYHKVILSWLRYSYEWPFNIAMYEVFKLKNTPGFKRLNLLNLFNIVGPSMDYSKHGCDIHAIGEFDMFKELLSWKEFKKIVNKLNKINYRHEINAIINKKHIHGDFIQVPDNYKKTCTTYWENEKEFKKRVKVYKTNLKSLKETK